MNRREFLKLAGAGALTLAAADFYLNDEKMARPHEPEGRVIADLHAHPSKHNTPERISEALCWGVTGLSGYHFKGYELTYDEAISIAKVEEIDKGLFAKITYKSGTGYIMKTQEVLSGHHILAIGCKEVIQPHYDARKTVEEIHRRGGMAILNHPEIITTGNQVARYRLITEDEEKQMSELCDMVDEIEAFNAQCINLSNGLLIPDMRIANERAKALAKNFGFKGVAASDTHMMLEQLKIAGIYLPKDNLSTEAVKHHITSGNFERLEQYVSRLSFLRGHLGGLLNHY